MRIKVSMGFFAFCNGRTHFSRKTRDDLVQLPHTRGLLCYRTGSTTRPFVTPAVAKMTPRSELRNPERASPGRPPATSALECDSGSRGAAPLNLGLFLVANISTNMHVKTAIFEGQCSSGFPNPESRSIGGDFLLISV